MRAGTTSILILGLGLLPARAASQPDAQRILRRIDRNMQFTSARFEARMTIVYREGDRRVMEFETWNEGTGKGLIEFTAPARDAGSRFLRLDDVMYYYLPRIGKSVRIQGHMLRQGLMGSDFSLGDATENDSLVEDYRATVEGDTTLGGRPVLILHLVGQREDLAYPSLRLWVDAERYVPLREERYARSGRLLKTATLNDVRQVAGIWYPFTIELDNALQADTRTLLEITDIEVGIDIPDKYFTLRYLEGGG